MMPTKRRVILFFFVLSLMLLAKYVWGQEDSATVGWDPATACGPPSDAAYAVAAMVYGPIFGLFAGAIRVSNRNALLRAGRLYQNDLVMLKL